MDQSVPKKKRKKSTSSFYAWYSTYFALGMISKALEVPKTRLLEKACDLYLSEEWLSNVTIEDDGIPGSASIVSLSLENSYYMKIKEIEKKTGYSKSKILNAVLMRLLKEINRTLPILKKHTIGLTKEGDFLFSLEGLKCKKPYESDPELAKKVKKVFYNDRKRPVVLLFGRKSKWELALYLAENLTVN